MKPYAAVKRFKNPSLKQSVSRVVYFYCTRKLIKISRPERMIDQERHE